MSVTRTQSTASPPTIQSARLDGVERGKSALGMNMATDTRIRKAAGRKASPLTAREAEIVALLARGLSNTTIGEELGIAIKTVQNHMNSILAKVAPPPWAEPRVYLSLWHLGDSERLRKLAAGPGDKKSPRKKAVSAS